MKSLALLGAAVAALFVASCRGTTESSDGMMSGKEGSACADKKEGCPFMAAAKKDDCCAGEAKADAKKSGCCAEGAAVKAEKKSGCCMEGKSEAKAVKECCKGKAISEMCSDCKKSGEGSCESEKDCDGQKKCEDKAKP